MSSDTPRYSLLYLLEQRHLFVDAPVLVILDAERHLVSFDDGHGGGNLLVEPFDRGSPALKAVEHLVAPAEQAHHAQARGAGLLGYAHRVLEDIRILARQERLDFDIHAELFFQLARPASPVEIDLGHAAVRAGRADRSGEVEQWLDVEKPLWRAEANRLERIGRQSHRCSSGNDRHG